MEEKQKSNPGLEKGPGLQSLLFSTDSSTLYSSLQYIYTMSIHVIKKTYTVCICKFI